MISPLSIPPLRSVSIWSKMLFARSMPRESTGERVGAASSVWVLALGILCLRRAARNFEAPCWRSWKIQIKAAKKNGFNT